MHYFYATNTPLVTIITTGILATPRGIEPRFMTSKAIVLPLDDRVLLVPVARFELARFWHSVLSRARLPFHHTGMVLSVGNDPTFLVLQASTLTISVKTAFGNATGIRTRDTSLKGK